MRFLRVLFVDDKSGIREALPPILERHGFVVTRSSTVNEALSEITSALFDVLISDPAGPTANKCKRLREAVTIVTTAAFRSRGWRGLKTNTMCASKTVPIFGSDQGSEVAAKHVAVGQRMAGQRERIAPSAGQPAFSARAFGEPKKEARFAVHRHNF